ncbi:MAG: hypothetical protein ACK4VN_07375 [Bacteroidales bacterium]
MKTITFRVKNQKDYYLLKEIAERLGIDILEQQKDVERTGNSRTWSFLGSVDLNRTMDKLKIRDFAHE